MLDDGMTDPRLALPVGLSAGRAHEFCGPARRVLAAWMMGPHAPVLWLRLRHDGDRLNPHGLAEWARPGDIVMAEAARMSELLSCAEDGLRSGACALVVAELPDPPGLTPVRRLHLAAQDGVARRRARAGHDAMVAALLLTPEDGGCAGVESRWHLAPCPPDATPGGQGRAAWRLGRRRARMEPPADWHVTHAAGGLAARRLPA
jgi:protein ImuA